MKRTIPLLITFLAGTILIVASFIPYAQDWKTDVLVWFDILASIAFVLGGGNLLMMHLKKVSDRPPGWGYSVVTLVAFLFTLIVGTFKIGSHPADQSERYGESAAVLKLGDFPQTFTAAGRLPEAGLPAILKGQLTAGDEGTVSFKGWMTEQQRGELERSEYEADWHGTVAELFEKSQPPGTVKDKIEFHAQLERLFFRGPMTPGARDALLALSGEPNWNAAIETLFTESNLEHTVELTELPPGFKMPESVDDVIALDPQTKTLSITGPMSVQQRDALVNAFPKGGVLSSDEREQLKQSLAELGPLDPALAEVIDKFAIEKETAGRRNHELLFEMLNVARKQGLGLNDRQRQFLLEQYNAEVRFQVKVAELFSIAHQVKYSFSGKYDDEGSILWYIYEFALWPLMATMFSLLAFYVSSAAFRAFRAKNVEATLLLGTAFIVLLGRTYLGTAMTAWIPEALSSLTGWVPETFSSLTIPGLTIIIMNVFLTAGNRAIMIGIALGIVSTSLKILLGIDRSYLGSDRE